MIEKYTFMDYISTNYVTLLMLLGLLLILFINRRAEIGGIKVFPCDDRHSIYAHTLRGA